MGPASRLTILGLAPGLHGANKTGQPFTGDASGELLFRVLDQLAIKDQVRITNVVKCAPPQNKPLTSERKNCQKFLSEEIGILTQSDTPQVVLCLGRIAHEELLRCLSRRISDYPFFHGAVHQPKDNLHLVDSFHCSRYNIQTNRLTEPMFRSAVQCAANIAQLNLS
jgi:uracil-DNA glycosylase family 4